MKVKAKNKVKQNDFSFGDNLAGSISNSSAIKGTCSNPASGVAPSVKFAYKREPSPMLGRKGKDAQHLDTYPCHFCDKVFCTSEKLTFHTYSHTGERPCRCSHQGCTKAFISKYKLIRHMATHSTQQSHACSYCDKTFHRKDHLKNHLQTHDPNKMAFKCEECGKKYNTKLGYKRHLALHAATSGDLTCRVCTQEFENTVILLDHLKSHAGKPSVGIKEKKHKCDHCEHHFYTRKDVRRHMVVHTGCKDFLCQFCDQRFGRKDHLTRHTKKTHSQELLKGRLHNGDFQGLLDPMSSFRLKQDGSMLHSFPRQELVPNEIMSSLQARHTSPLFQSRHNMEPSHPVESAAFEQSMGPLDNCLATHPMSLHSVGSSPKHTLNKYEFSSTSFPSPTIKNPPIMLDVKDYNASLLEELPLPESRSPHKINNKVSMQASSESTVNASEYIMPKDEVAISETVAMSPLEISHILGLWQLPSGNMVSVDTSVPFESNTAHHIMTFPGHQPQDLPIPMGSVGLHQLPHFTQTFSSSSPALPHFHHAFK
ncbi:zinc finger protein PLAGL1 isoform X1 [Ambystoma mexicanum]|uniref:zinc finger protein PLAGL1 isoform X1 n=1 Tax=Ambystoma mexicanum TaxID=8296 RepID=UPI0037E95912